MGNVSFYCTRCRRLTKFPATCREAIVRCPYCQQALIVPSIPADDEHDSNADFSKVVVPPARTGEVPQVDSQDYYAFNATDSGVLVRSHLNREKSRRIVPIAGEPSSKWSVWGANEQPVAPPESESSVFQAESEVSDDEFMSRLRADDREISHARPSVPPPVVTDVGVAPDYATLREAPGLESSRFQYVVISVAALLTVVLSVVIGVLAYRAGRSDAIDPQLAPSEPISVEGRVVYRDKSGRSEGDEGALLFFFPADRAFDKPLIASGLSPQDAEPGDYEEFFAELAKEGGYFATVGFDGYFTLEIAEPGDYRFLVVSKHVEDAVDAEDREKIGEISKYLFLPERKLLARSRFLWSTETIDKQSGAIEKDFGKSADVGL